jgi:PAS domain-containing protein
MGAARELHGVSKTGRAVPVEIGLTTLQIDGEQFVLAFVLDLTEHKKQEEKFRLVVEAAPNGMIMVGPHGKSKLANHEACAMFGFAQEEMIG